jgi:hypothetical protein
MEHLAHNIKVLWRSERLLKMNELRILSHKIMCNALAGLVAIFGLVMLSLAAFFALVPFWGNALAALFVGGADILMSGILVIYAKSLKPAAEVEMIREMRDKALDDIEEKVAQAEAEFVALKDDVYKFIRNPVDSLLHYTIGPFLSAIVRSLRSSKKQGVRKET